MESTREPAKKYLSTLPSVDRVLNYASLAPLIATFGRVSVVDAIRAQLARARSECKTTSALMDLDEAWFEQHCRAHLEAEQRPSLRPIFNLTGTVLHTNLGRALLPKEAQEAVAAVLTQPCNLEYELDSGSRGDRDDHIERLICELTGAEAATVVNNNAAAVFLLLNTFALNREVPVSRGELIEIGGSFRIPDIMTRAGCRLREVGTTNRTHLADFVNAVNAETALLLKVHTSNYAIQGFTAAPDEKELARLAHQHELPFAIDLGSGTVIDLRDWNLPAEPTPQQALASGADIVTFSGDKLLGGPQAGIIVGGERWIAAIKRNPLKRALRVGKMTLAALEAVLRLYRDPARLAQRLPILRLLTRKPADITACASRVLPAVQKALDGYAAIAIEPCHSQIGSGSLPIELLPSCCLALRPLPDTQHRGALLARIASAFRALPTPVIGRIADGALRFDLRCLEDEGGFAAQLGKLAL